MMKIKVHGGSCMSPRHDVTRVRYIIWNVSIGVKVSSQQNLGRMVSVQWSWSGPVDVNDTHHGERGRQTPECTIWLFNNYSYCRQRSWCADKVRRGPALFQNKHLVNWWWCSTFSAMQMLYITLSGCNMRQQESWHVFLVAHIKWYIMQRGLNIINPVSVLAVLPATYFAGLWHVNQFFITLITHWLA